MNQLLDQSLTLHEMELDDDSFVCGLCDRDPTWAIIYSFPCPHDGVKDYFCDLHREFWDHDMRHLNARCIDCGKTVTCTHWKWERL